MVRKSSTTPSQKGFMLQIRTSQSKDIIFSSEISNITKSDQHLSFRSVKQIDKSIREGNFLFALRGKELAGFAEVVRIWRNWYAIFSFFVRPKYRRQGISKLLLHKIITSNQDDYLYAATSNKIMLNILEINRFERYKFKCLPVLFLTDYFIKRFLNLQLFGNIGLLDQYWYYLVRSPNN
ncbi:MAG TPA: GNAT family N-acetyltransferase [Patescibacteria group bacterium]|nr:GNAT family N-acetyltransferase [Patescibacteria group bacterium]